MMTKNTLFFLLFGLFSYTLKAQEKDFGTWYNAGIGYEVIKKTEINFETCIRTDQNASHINQFHTEGGISYKFNKYIAVSANYRWMLKDESYNNYFSRHRIYSDLRASYPIYNFKLSLRGRWQCQYKQYANDPEDKLPTYYFRLKAQIYYNWPFSKFDPYISAEWFYPLNYNAVNYADQKRFAGGIEYNISKKHALDAGFIYQREYLPKLSDIGIVSLGYSFKFK